MEKVLHVYGHVLRMFPAGSELYELLEHITKSKTKLDQQVSETIEALQRSSELISQLEQSLEKRTKEMAELQKEYQRYSELSKIEEEKTKALIQQLEATLGKDRSQERRFNIAITIIFGFVFIVIGALLSDPLKILVNEFLKIL